MSPFDVNEHGVPQYPKGHAGRLLVTLAAIAILTKPTSTSIAALTGVTKGRVDDYVLQLGDQYGVEILRAMPRYIVRSWGSVLNPAGVMGYLGERLNGPARFEKVLFNGILDLNPHPLGSSSMISISDRQAILTPLDHRTIDKTLKIIFDRIASDDLRSAVGRNALQFLLFAVDDGHSALINEWVTGWQRVGIYDEREVEAGRSPILSPKERAGVERMLADLISALDQGQISMRNCVGGFTQIMAAIDCGNHGEVLAWIDNGVPQFRHAS